VGCHSRPEVCSYPHLQDDTDHDHHVDQGVHNKMVALVEGRMADPVCSVEVWTMTVFGLGSWQHQQERESRSSSRECRSH
jgi:hypothetical protein